MVDGDDDPEPIFLVNTVPMFLLFAVIMDIFPQFSDHSCSQWALTLDSLLTSIIAQGRSSFGSNVRLLRKKN